MKKGWDVRQVTLVYLDQNKWIDLARAHYNRPGGEPFRSVLEQVEAAVGAARAIFPLSDAHVIETYKERDTSRRERLAQVMVKISQGWMIAPASYTCPRELEVAVARFFDEEDLPWPEVLGRGIAFAFGRSDELQSDLGISEKRAQLVEAAMDTPAGLTAFLVGVSEPLLTRGTSDFERRATVYAQSVEEARSAGRNYSKSVRKRAYVADLTYYLQPRLARALASYELTLTDFLGLGKQQLMSFFESVPTLDVEIELATERDGHWDKEVDPNDMTDISFLSVAIPYCDVVVTEKFWADLAKRKKLDEKYETVVLSDLLELECYLSD